MFEIVHLITGEGHGSGAVHVAQGDQQAAETTGTTSIAFLPLIFPNYY
jgi:hypothetical protein